MKLLYYIIGITVMFFGAMVLLVSEPLLLKILAGVVALAGWFIAAMADKWSKE